MWELWETWFTLHELYEANLCIFPVVLLHYRQVPIHSSCLRECCNSISLWGSRNYFCSTKLQPNSLLHGGLWIMTLIWKIIIFGWTIPLNSNSAIFSLSLPPQTAPDCTCCHHPRSRRPQTGCCWGWRSPGATAEPSSSVWCPAVSGGP